MSGPEETEISKTISSTYHDILPGHRPERLASQMGEVRGAEALLPARTALRGLRASGREQKR